MQIVQPPREVGGKPNGIANWVQLLLLFSQPLPWPKRKWPARCVNIPRHGNGKTHRPMPPFGWPQAV